MVAGEGGETAQEIDEQLSGSRVGTRAQVSIPGFIARRRDRGWFKG
jgi:hypothetical protein